MQRGYRSYGSTQTPPTSAPKRPPPQPGWQPFAVAEKLVPTPEQLTLARLRWSEGTPAQITVPPHVSLKSVNMAMELEGLSFALTNSTTNQGAA